MKGHRVLIGVVVAVLLLATGGTYAQGPGAESDGETEAALSTAFTYQGRLEDESGPVDGTCDLTFALYDAAGAGTPPTGGTLLGTVNRPGEILADGYFTVLLDFGAAAFAGDRRWLQVTLDCGDGAVTLAPRQELTAAPYALYAPPTHSHWGQEWSGSGIGLTLTGGYSGMEAIGDARGVYGRSNTTTGIGVVGYASAVSGTTTGVRGSSASVEGTGVYGIASATSGTTYGTFGRSDSPGGTGVGGYASATSGTTNGVYGRSASTQGRGVYGWASAGSGTTYGVYGESASTSGRGVYGYANASSGNTYGVYGSSASPSGRGVFGHAFASSGTTYGVFGKNYSNEGTGVYGYATSSTGTTKGVYGTSESPEGCGVVGYAFATTGTTSGVYGWSQSTDGHGVHGYNSRGFGYDAYGVYGESASPLAAGVYGVDNATSGAPVGVEGKTSSTVGKGVAGRATSTSGRSYGVFGESTSPGGVGVSGQGYYAISAFDTFDTSDSLAAFFDGNILIWGNLEATGSKAFRIDHPLDPENKYLYHYSIESSEVLNQYSGNVTLDTNGEARVELPEWFQAINTDYRYQLTPIGAAMPWLHIAQGIEGNTFYIAGGEPGMEVSWQITALRNDPYMQQNPQSVETAKPEDERGLYQHPELYGKPPEMVPAHYLPPDEGEP